MIIDSFVVSCKTDIHNEIETTLPYFLEKSKYCLLRGEHHCKNYGYKKTFLLLKITIYSCCQFDDYLIFGQEKKKEHQKYFVVEQSGCGDCLSILVKMQ